MSLYSALARPALFALDAERAHDLTMMALSSRLAPSVLHLGRQIDDQTLRVEAFGLTFRNPIGLAAGLDKQGTAVSAWAALGFGFAEIGTVTPRPQPGNPPPRLFRLPEDRAIVNRFGFNSEGAEGVAANLTKSGRPAGLRIGINLGKNKDTPNERAVEDYLQALDVLCPLADYLVINVSSPNTAGLRSLQDRDALQPIVEAVVDRASRGATGRMPVLVKVSPDMTDEELLASADAAVFGGASGIIATNTTTTRSGLRTTSDVVREVGGLSGAPLRQRADAACRTLFRHLRGRLPIVGVGGIFTADDAYRRIRSGATLVQVYTGLIYEGPGMVAQLAAGLAQHLRRDRFTSIAEATGIDVD